MIEALYIHIPFCTSRCSYCDFSTSACHDDAVMDAYVDALQLQLRRASKAGLLSGIKTIYLGGGTPTHLGARRLNSLVYMISLSLTLENVEEFTVEANPESLGQSMVKDLYALGVNRMSIGAQSFDDEVLRAYGRVHDAVAIARAVEAVKTRDMRFSLDLICGGPGQSMESWRKSVEAALELGAHHVSIYPLTVEDGTPLAARVAAGEWGGPVEEEEAAMMEAAQELLESAGLHRYEVASYAAPGRESQHNTAYWSGKEYLGLGAGAASMLSAKSWRACVDAGIFGAAELEVADEVGGATQGAAGEPGSGVGADATLVRGAAQCELPAATARVRVQASASVSAFSESLGRPAVQLECMDAREALLEDVMLAFRRSAGLSAQLEQRACAAIKELALALQRLQDAGLVARNAQGALAPTERGWLMGNEVFGTIWSLA